MIAPLRGSGVPALARIFPSPRQMAAYSGEPHRSATAACFSASRGRGLLPLMQMALIPDIETARIS